MGFRLKGHQRLLSHQRAGLDSEGSSVGAGGVHSLVQGTSEVIQDKNLVTVWSAPNYCYRCNNLAAIMEVKESGEKEFKIFKTVPESMKSVHFKNVLPYFL